MNMTRKNDSYMNMTLENDSEHDSVHERAVAAPRLWGNGEACLIHESKIAICGVSGDVLSKVLNSKHSDRVQRMAYKQKSSGSRIDYYTTFRELGSGVRASGER